MPHSILLVDDDSDLLEILVNYFTRRGFDVVGASHYQQALREAEQHMFQVAVLDRCLGEHDGLSLISDLHSRAAELEVIVLSGCTDEGDKEAALSLGAFAYLTKPTSLKTIEEIIQSAAGVAATKVLVS
jgi:DNA-binding response OmpR family regulator